MLDRRHLEFDQIDAIMPEVDRLMTGHTTVGQWTLGSICDHLARTICLSLDMESISEPPTREQSINRRLFFRSKGFPDGQTPPFASQQPNPDADPIESCEALRQSIERLRDHPGPFPAHPVLGPMTRDEWLSFHARHAAHHLSFVHSA